ncbi:SRPBCC family protein [Alteromonas sp. A081]|uniref:SRPBCC family protein n=1 Tax=Alteromonas sp. A081 TaxID=3410269 RepID=UPI003B984AF2
MHQFTIDVTFTAPLSFIYASFHEVEYLSQWFAPGNCSVTQVMNDFKEGGRYRIKMMEPNGVEMSLTGEYVTILTDEQLAFSWAWEDNLDESHITSVNLHFKEVEPDRINVVLMQSGFVNKEECNQHEYAWMSCLEKLAVLADRQKALN